MNGSCKCLEIVMKMYTYYVPVENESMDFRSALLAQVYRLS